MTCTAIEPSSEGRIMEDALKTTEETKDVKFSWRQEKLEDYRKGCHGYTKFHVISAINSLYYVDDLESDLSYLLSSVEPGGFLIVVLDSGQLLSLIIVIIFLYHIQRRNLLWQFWCLEFRHLPRTLISRLKWAANFPNQKFGDHMRHKCQTAGMRPRPYSCCWVRVWSRRARLIPPWFDPDGLADPSCTILVISLGTRGVPSQSVWHLWRSDRQNNFWRSENWRLTSVC